MFGFGETRVTYEELAEGLYNFAVDFSDQIANHELKNPNSPYAGVDGQYFLHEWLLPMFWVMHRVITDCDKERLMGLIHKNYFQDAGLMTDKVAAVRERNLMISRYDEYDSAFDPGAGAQQFVLGGTIAKNLLQQNKLVLDATIQFKAATDALLLMKEVKEIADKYKVRD